MWKQPKSTIISSFIIYILSQGGQSVITSL